MLIFILQTVHGNLKFTPALLTHHINCYPIRTITDLRCAATEGYHPGQSDISMHTWQLLHIVASSHQKRDT